MLVFAAFVPHPLIAVPELGKGQTARVRYTLKSYKELASELYAVQPHTIVTISPHAPGVTGLFTVNQHPHPIVSFAAFGNLSDHLVLNNNLGFGYRLKESIETSMPIALTEDNFLDYGTSVALFHLLRPFKPELIRVVPIGSSTRTLEEQYRFGREIDRQLQHASERIAVIATGDLSHGASRSSVATYTAKAAAFNKGIRTALEHKDAKSLLSITDAELEQVVECGARPLAVLLGVLGERAVQPRVLSYEAALGVGYLTAAFDFA